jgi:hypothetical protein
LGRACISAGPASRPAEAHLGPTEPTRPEAVASTAGTPPPPWRACHAKGSAAPFFSALPSPARSPVSPTATRAAPPTPSPELQAVARRLPVTHGGGCRIHRSFHLPGEGDAAMRTATSCRASAAPSCRRRATGAPPLLEPSRSPSAQAIRRRPRFRPFPFISARGERLYAIPRPPLPSLHLGRTLQSPSAGDWNRQGVVRLELEVGDDPCGFAYKSLRSPLSYLLVFVSWLSCIKTPRSIRFSRSSPSGSLCM